MDVAVFSMDYHVVDSASAANQTVDAPTCLPDTEQTVIVTAIRSLGQAIKHSVLTLVV